MKSPWAPWSLDPKSLSWPLCRWREKMNPFILADTIFYNNFRLHHKVLHFCSFWWKLCCVRLKLEMEDYVQQQKDEVEALSSIFDSDFTGNNVFMRWKTLQVFKPTHFHTHRCFRPWHWNVQNMPPPKYQCSGCARFTNFSFFKYDNIWQYLGQNHSS